jgi:hypothetical protein
MGVIDKNTAVLKCPQCQVTETLTALERGSAYGNSGWGTFGTAKHFDVVIEDSGFGGPRITGAKCKQCNSDAAVENS